MEYNMKIITLKEDTVIKNKLYRKGQVVRVEDSFNVNLDKVVSEPKEIKHRILEEKTKIDFKQKEQQKEKLEVKKKK